MRGAYLFGRGRNLKVAQFISINLIALPRRRELEGRSRSGAKDGNRRPLNPIHIPRTFAAKCGSIQNGDIFLAMPKPTGASAHSFNRSDRPVVDHASTAASGGRLTRFEKDPGARTSTSFGAIKKAIG